MKSSILFVLKSKLRFVVPLSTNVDTETAILPQALPEAVIPVMVTLLQPEKLIPLPALVFFAVRLVKVTLL